MPSVCFYFQVHQPCRLRHYTVFDEDHRYFDDFKNKSICRKVANKCYLPANRLILDLIKQHKGKFKVAYSITGVLLEQLAQYAPEVMSTFDALARTGCVEFLGETYYHSLSFLYSRNEFKEQIYKHLETMEKLFDQRPRIFRNTELIYCNDLVDVIESMGLFDAILTEGADKILQGRSPNFIYTSPRSSKMKLLLKNYALSDDIAFRFSNKDWREWPLMANKFSQWVSKVNGNGYVVNLFMDYETFGEHQWEDTGIFEFMRHLPGEIMKNSDNNFKTPSEVAASFPASGVIDVPNIISWADTERDLSAWLGNPLQSSALHELYRMEQQVKLTGDSAILQDWRKLQTSDHFYYMCTKWFADGDVHKYFNPYDSPYDSYINFMNCLGSLEKRFKKKITANPDKAERKAKVKLTTEV